METRVTLTTKEVHLRRSLATKKLMEPRNRTGTLMRIHMLKEQDSKLMARSTAKAVDHLVTKEAVTAVVMEVRSMEAQAMEEVGF